MSMKNKILAIGFLFVLALGLFVGYRIGKPNLPGEQVSSQSIVQALKHEGFLVTETYIITQQITIDRSTGSAFKDFFWGQDITAFGTMKTSMGVDLNKLTPEDITLTSNRISLTVPSLEDHGVELIGDITLKNNQGIFKKVFNNDDGYNAAYAKLKESAILTAKSDLIQNEARENTKKEIERLIQLIAGNRQVEIIYK
ncbi:MAG: DUF4230 domain-containing protein [Candidatus Magasanikbacteria bacterium]|nr:DUF4230 domain-containing protein [Candidatus Magasanikbacteria bacterium]